MTKNWLEVPSTDEEVTDCLQSLHGKNSLLDAYEGKRFESNTFQYDTQECELGKHEFSGGQCVHCGEMDREGAYPDAKRDIHVNFSNPQNVSKK